MDVNSGHDDAPGAGEQIESADTDNKPTAGEQGINISHPASTKKHENNPDIAVAAAKKPKVVQQRGHDGDTVSKHDGHGKTMNHPNNNNSRQKRKLAYRSRHRLLSINRDAKDLKQRALTALTTSNKTKHDYFAINCNSWPWLPNKQCGSWYLSPQNNDESTPIKQTEVYFKSTDGHVGTYAISLKRLNLPLLEVLHQFGGCFLVDSSVRKLLPDSFSRTIPIWCAVINRIVLKYRASMGMDDISDDDWDTQLYTPSSIVSPEEHTEISNLIDSRVELLYQSKAIVDPQRLVQIVTKPVRAIWIANGLVQYDTTTPCSSGQGSRGKFFTIACFNPSYYFGGSSSKNHIHWVDIKGDDGVEVVNVTNNVTNNVTSNGDSTKGYYYTPGAADDDASWGRGLSASLFWENRERILSPSTEDGTDAMIDSIVNEWQQQQQNDDVNNDSKSSLNNMDKIGDMNLWIGSRRAGRPPECWETFDAILNVTENEYSNMKPKEDFHKATYYLQLPVQEGKKDKIELERWMPVGLAFLITHLQQKRRVLVHCAQGRDRSVGIVLAFVALFCPPLFPLKVRLEFESLDIGSIHEFANENDNNQYLISGLSSSLVGILLKENGKDLFLKWMHQQLQTSIDKPFASKDSLRIVLHLVRQDRENAEPTRSTMQKLNRFFMSRGYRSLK
ncbi:hypothetical protein ACHAXR_010794 [Thalassiosira sp. AJA248-18]